MQIYAVNLEQTNGLGWDTFCKKGMCQTSKGGALRRIDR